MSVFLWLLVLLLLVPHPTHAQEGEPFLDRWKGVRGTIAERGVRLQFVNTTDILGNVAGESAPVAIIPGAIDLLLRVDAQRLVGWKDATFFLYGLGLYGGQTPEDRDGQGISSIQGENGWNLFEAWYQQNLFQDRVSLLAGLYEVTSEFDVLRSAYLLFVHSSFGTNPPFALSGKNGPATYPYSSLGFRAQAKLTDHLTLRAVVADGVPGDPDDPGSNDVILGSDDGVLVTTEAAYYLGKPESGQEVPPTHFSECRDERCCADSAEGQS